MIINKWSLINDAFLSLHDVPITNPITLNSSLDDANIATLLSFGLHLPTT